MNQLSGNGHRVARPSPRWIFLLLLAMLLGQSRCGSRDRQDEAPGPWDTAHRAGIEARARGHYAAADSALNLALVETAVFQEPDRRLHSTLRHLAEIGVIRGQTARAGSLYSRLLEIQQRHLGPEASPALETATRLAELYREQGELARAETLYAQVLAVWEAHLDPRNPGVAAAVGGLAVLRRERGDYVGADALEKRQLGLKLYEQAYAYYLEGKIDRAEEYYRRALAVQERHQGATHPDLYRTCVDLARICEMREEWGPAEDFYRRAIASRQGPDGAAGPALSGTLEALASVLERAGRTGEAEGLRERARAGREGAPAPP